MRQVESGVGILRVLRARNCAPHLDSMHPNVLRPRATANFGPLRSCALLRRWVWLSLSVAALDSPAAAQSDLDKLRDSLSRAVRAARYPAFLSALIDLNSESELAGARLEDQGDPTTKFDILTYPWRRDFENGPFGTRWELEATLGYSTVRYAARGLFAATDPQLSTDLDTRFRLFGAILGAGPVLPLGERFELRPTIELGAAYVENHARYSGPGAATTAALADGIVFNWQAAYSIAGLSATLAHRAWLWRGVQFEPLVRVDGRVTSALHADDAAQEGSTHTGWAVARLGASGDLGIRWAGAPLSWNSRVGYKRFFDNTAELLDFRDYLELGAGLSLGTEGCLPLLSEVGFDVTLVFGEDVSGWAVGLSASL